MKTIILNLLKNFFFIGKTKPNLAEALTNQENNQNENAFYDEYVHYYQQATRWQSVVQE